MTISNNHQAYRRIRDALTHLTHDINYLADNANPRHQEDRAETVARFANALHTLTIHSYNLTLSPALAEDEEYMRMVCEGYDRDITTQPDLLEVETLIWLTNFHDGKHTTRHMQVTGYDAATRRHELTFTLTDGTTITATAPYATNLETAILENLRITEKTLIPKKDFTLRKSKRHEPALCLTIHTSLT